MAIKFLNTVQVDTDVLYVDAANDRVGIGTNSPSVYHKLDVNGSANFSADITVGRNATALSFDMNPAYDSGNYYLNLHKNQSNDGGVLLYSKPTSGSAQLDWQIVNQGTTGDLKFYAAGLAGNALVLDRETGNLQLPEYGAGTLVSDASGNITVSSGGGAGGPYLPLAGGTMTGNLFIEGASTPKITITDTTNNLEGRIRVANNYMYIEADNSDAVVSTRMVLKTDGVEALYLDGNQNATFAGAIAVQGTGDSYFTGNVGIGTTSPSYKLDVDGNARFLDSVYVNTSTGSGGLFVTRLGGASESLKIYTTDSTSVFETFQDENIGGYGSMAFILDDGAPDPSYVFRYGSIVRLKIEGGTGDVILGNALLSNQENTNVGTGAEVVAQVSTSTYTAAFFDFVIKKVGNIRSGTVYACHDGTNVEFTETSTNDIGDTSDVVLSVDISGGNMRLLADAATSGWSVKSLIRAI
jgi:hypothetical protein